MDRKWWTLIAVSVGTFMLLLDVTIVNVALPSIQTSLKANFSDLQWVVDAYALTLAALLLTTGSLADLFGRRRIFVIGLVVFSASSLASGLAQSPLWLNLARGAQGVGAAAMFSTSLALLGHSFRGRERGVAFGVWGAITGLAVAVGPVIGGALTTGLSWRWIFLVNVPIGIVAVLICLARVEESRQARARKPDLIGVVTFSGALGALVYALIKGDTKGWTSGVILACLIGAGVLMVAFLIAEHVQGDRAMFDLSLFRKPTFTGGSLAAFALSGGLFALFLYLTLYLQEVLGYTALQTGLRFLVLSGGILLTSTLAGRLTAFVPIRFLIAPGLVMVGGGLLLMRGLNPGSHWTHFIPGFIVAGAGTGLINPPLASTAIGVVTPDRAGMASGINSTFRQVGTATGIAGLGAIFTHTVRIHIESLLAGAPGVSAAQASALADGVAQGTGAHGAIASLPVAARPAAVHALRASFATGLNDVFLVGAVLALATAVLTLILIRSKDFEVGSARSAPPPVSRSAGPGVPPAPHAGRPVAEPRASAAPPAPAAAPASGNGQSSQFWAGPADRATRAAGNGSTMFRMDVRRVEQAAQIAEEAALEYAREIGQARAILTQVATHLDRAAEARVRLNDAADEIGDFRSESSGLEATFAPTAVAPGQSAAPAPPAPAAPAPSAPTTPAPPTPAAPAPPTPAPPTPAAPAASESPRPDAAPASPHLSPVPPPRFRS